MLQKDEYQEAIRIALTQTLEKMALSHDQMSLALVDEWVKALNTSFADNNILTLFLNAYLT